jgi:hypothetical protein
MIRTPHLLALASFLYACGSGTSTGDVGDAGTPALRSKKDAHVCLSIAEGASTMRRLFSLTCAIFLCACGGGSSVAEVGDAASVSDDSSVADGGPPTDGSATTDAHTAGKDGGATAEYRRVFVTSTIYTGNLGGLSGADAKCQSRADAAKLPGTYKVWLSAPGPDASPTTRIVHSTLPYGLVDGTIVANDWNDLTDGRLLAPINQTEFGGGPPATAAPCATNAPEAAVFTATTPSGTYTGTQALDTSCASWTSNVGLTQFGSTGTTSPPWTAGCVKGCQLSAALFCVEQ